MIVYDDARRPTVEEYVDFLARSDLGTLYPRRRFGERVRRLLREASICVTARDPDGVLVGVALGITDHAYFLFLTDLGVARDRVRQGIGRELVRRAHLAAGGPEEINAVSWSNAEALGFYAASGWLPHRHLVARAADAGDRFTVTGPEDLRG